MGGTSSYRACPLPKQRFYTLNQSTSRIHQVIHYQAILPAHIADNVHYFRHVDVRAALVYNRQRTIQPLGEGTCTLYAAGIRRNHRHVSPPVTVLEILDHHWRSKQVVDRNIKKTLDLSCVEIEGQNPVGTRPFKQTRYQFSRNRHARAILAILPRISIIG